jgi:hypothetical protein
VGDFATKRAGKDRNPLEPLASFTWLLMTLLVFGFALAVFTTLFGSGSILGWGHDAYVCVSSTGFGDGDAKGSLPFIHPHAGVSADSPGLRLCTASPSATQRWWYTLENLPTTVTFVALSVATFLILRHAERHGLYAPGVASRIRFLGWFLIADSVLRPVVEVIATRRLWASMADSSAPIQWNVVWTFLFAGLALLSLARIMRVGSGMREELQGVV